MSDERKWALMVRSNEVRSGLLGNPVVTQSGEWFIVENEPEGWVEATSINIGGGSAANLLDEWLGRSASNSKHIKRFNSPEEAESFARRWRGHPWYCKPSGKFSVVEIKPVYKRVVDSWRVSS